MTAGTDALKQAFRDFQTDGIPATGLNEPAKPEVRAALDSLGLDIVAAGAGTDLNAVRAVIEPIRDEALTARDEAELGADRSQTIADGLSVLVIPTGYQFGRRIVWAVGADDGQAPVTLDELGFLNVTLPIRSRYGFGVTLNEADGFYEFDPSGMELSRYNLSGGGGLEGGTSYYHDGKAVRWAVAADGQSPLFVDEDGTTYAERLVVTEISGSALANIGTTSPVIGPTHMFSVEAIDGARQILATPLDGTATVQVTTAGSNYAPAIVGDKVIYWSDRSGARRAYYAKENLTRSGSTIEHPVSPNARFMPLGNSIMAAGWINGVASHFGLPLEVPASSAAGGTGSQRGEQIGARFGAAGVAGAPQLTASFVGDQLVAGPNRLTAINIPLLSRAGDVAGTVRSLKAWVAGVHGSLTSTQKTAADATTIAPIWGMDNYTYTFTPDADPSSPIAAPAGTVIEIDPETRQDAILFVDIARNNVGQGPGWGDVVKTWLRAILTVYKPLVKRIVVVGGTNSTAEFAGATGNNAAGYPLSQAYADLVALNLEMRDIAAEFGALFYDPRPIFNEGTANDTPKPAYAADAIHPNTAGYLAVYTNPIIALIEAAGWSFEEA